MATSKTSRADPRGSDDFSARVTQKFDERKSQRIGPAIWLLRVACILVAALFGLLRIELLTYFIASAN